MTECRKIWYSRTGHMCIAFWVTKDVNTHSEYVKLIAFALQQWLHERASLLSYTYTACLLVLKMNEQFVNNAVSIVRFHDMQ